MNKQELIREHKRLVKVLRHGSKKERDKEAADQQNELKTMQRGPEMKKVDKFLKTLTDAEREYLAGLLEAQEEADEGEEEESQDEKEDEVMETGKKPAYMK